MSPFYHPRTLRVFPPASNDHHQCRTDEEETGPGGCYGYGGSFRYSGRGLCDKSMKANRRTDSVDSFVDFRCLLQGTSSRPGCREVHSYSDFQDLLKPLSGLCTVCAVLLSRRLELRLCQSSCKGDGYNFFLQVGCLQAIEVVPAFQGWFQCLCIRTDTSLSLSSAH